ncbi:alpha/beta fold hydrolase [Sphingobacterium griseoflavum]|uniref:Alpha/beta hydrolase n=1 Tax=Sphingobacterium griseoflavum TaxID=1474952 RepID=A0ABQ3HXP6_9SPHI|nr:alpha/beta fold hydrolase [Sphingobacterium griseoflavum]GHE45041.1 alpha/beta hydrolase [Sphingobacterium griseoflavum]
MSERLIKSNKIRIGDISISYYHKKAQSVAAKTIIFLHGFPFNKNMWRPQLEALPDHIEAIAVDIRGHGNSTSGHGFFSIDVFAKDLRVFMDRLQIEHAVLCGISMGGYIALRAYELFPQKISGLVLADTHSKADSDVAKQKRFDSIQAVLSHGRRPFAIGFVENVFSPASIEQYPDTIEMIKSSIRRNSISTICATLLALAARTDTSATLHHIEVPTLLVRGAQDKITAKQDMMDLANAIPNNQFVEIAGAGHLPNLEDAAEFNKLLSDFLANM